MRRVAALALLLASAGPAAAATEEFLVEPGHTFPTFVVRHLDISQQRGRFDRTSGRITLDRDAGTGTISLAIEAGSVSTGNKSLDAVLKGEDFFDVEKHSRIAFRSESIEFEAGAPRRAKGELTLLGVTRPVTLEIARFNCTRLPFLVRLTCGADVTATIRRSDFGLKSYLNFVADEVRIEAQVEAVRQEPPPPAPAG